MSELQELMAGKRPGDKLTITYLHNKKKESKTVTLKNAQGNTSIVKSADLDCSWRKLPYCNRTTKE